MASYGAYEITSDPDLPLRKPATLEFGVPQGSNRERLAIYHRPDATWSRIGGTVTGNRIRVPIMDLSIYGLFEDASAAAGSGTVSNIKFSNRAFSPSGRLTRPGAGPQAGAPVLVQTTDISFELSAASSVRIAIYNRAGQLQNILTPGQQMNEGRNVVTWDGRDHSDNPVRSGLYIVSIDAGGEQQQKTVAVVNR